MTPSRLCNIEPLACDIEVGKYDQRLYDIEPNIITRITSRIDALYGEIKITF